MLLCIEMNEHLTCTVDTISSVARVAGAGETSLCVNALCILMTIVQVITPTFIDIYNEPKNNVVFESQHLASMTPYQCN